MLKTLGKQIKEFKAASIATPLFMLLEVLMETLVPFLMASIIDDGVNVPGGDIHHICVVGAWMIVAAAVGLFAGLMGGRYGAYASAGFAKNLRQAMYYNIQTFSFTNIDKYSTAGLVTRMTTDVTNVQNSYMMILRMGMRAPASMICAMAAAFLINARIASIYLIAVILLGIVLQFIIRKANKYFNIVFEKYDDLNASVQENVSAIRVVKAYVREEYETNKFAQASAKLYNMFVRAESIIACNMPVMMFTVYSCILLISWVGAHMIVSDSLTTGNLMSLLAYCMNILMSLMMLSMVFAMLTISLSSARRIAEVLEERTDIRQPEHPVMTVRDGAVDFDHVSFVYASKADKKVLDDIDLHIRSGETVGVIGGTGASKSSLVQLIPRLYDVTGGKLTLGGVDVRDYDLETLRNAVAMVLQKNELFSGTIAENLRWGNENATDEELRHACVLACADEFISAMPDGYDTYIEQGGTNVSGGQKQRLCIARALLKKPKVLILDDSTSAVDTRTDAQIQQALSAYIPETTKIIIAQRISSVQNADRIVVLDDGRIDAVDCHDELLRTCEIYREVYESQQKGGEDDA